MTFDKGRYASILAMISYAQNTFAQPEIPFDFHLFFSFKEDTLC